MCSSMKVLIVGINPAEPVTTRRKNTAWNRLQEWIDKLGIRDIHSFTNTILVPGQFDMSMVDWDRVREEASHGDAVIALGNFPSTVLKRLGVEHHRMPHPSYRNRVFNDPAREVHEIHRAGMYLIRQGIYG